MNFTARYASGFLWLGYIRLCSRLSKKSMSFRVTTILSIAVTLVLWASGFTAIGVALKSYSPFHIALLRFLIASVVLLLLTSFRTVRRPRRQDLFRIFLTGFFGIAAYNIALNYGKQFVTASAASFVVNTVPIFTTLFSIAFLRERIPLISWLGMALSFVGVSIIAIGESGLDLNRGALILVGTAVCQSLYFIIQKPLLLRYTSFEAVCYAIWIGMLCMLVFLPGLLPELRQASPAATGAVLYLGFFPSVAGYLCWSYVLSQLSASRAANFLYLVPALALLIAYVWLHELPTGISLAGGLLALGGVVVVNISKKLPVRGGTSGFFRVKS